MRDDPDRAVAAALSRERDLLRPEVRSSPRALDELLDPDFREIGASGKFWTRQEMIDALSASAAPGAPIRDEEMEGRRLTRDLVLLTYVSVASGRRARRTSLWRQHDNVWRILHHQGTLLT